MLKEQQLIFIVSGLIIWYLFIFTKKNFNNNNCNCSDNVFEKGKNN
mgnify:CR=1 FL=1